MGSSWNLVEYSDVFIETPECGNSQRLRRLMRMRYTVDRSHLFFLLTALLIAAGGCRPAEREPVAELAADTGAQGRVTQKAPEPEAEVERSTPAFEAQDTPRPTVDSPTMQLQATPTPQPARAESKENENAVYRVVFVESDDVLNVRSGPGIENGIVGTLAPGSSDLRATANAEITDGSLWLRIMNDEVAGWVNRRFLTEQLERGAFCQEEDVSRLVDSLREAVAGRDDDLLSALLDPQGGLRLNRHWWNPKIYIDHEDTSGLFESSETFHWGIADGTGESIDGSFADVILPLLDRDLLLANELGCDEIIHGGTAGLIKLPTPYDGIHFVSLHRAPDSDGFELDWGTWVAGIERREGQYYLSFLVHYEWEI
jgi:hypothetical protein